VGASGTQIIAQIMEDYEEVTMPDIEYSIRIVDEDGNGISGEEVSVHYELTHDSDYTDDDGWVTFEKSNLVYDGIRTTVYFKGETLAQDIWIEDGDTFSFTYNY